MLRHRLYTTGLVLAWIGGIEVIASFLARFWFQFKIDGTPFFFLALLVGLGLILAARIL